METALFRGRFLQSLPLASYPPGCPCGADHIALKEREASRWHAVWVTARPVGKEESEGAFLAQLRAEAVAVLGVLSEVTLLCYPPPMESREDRLESSLRNLLGCCELNLDEIEDETRGAINQALMVVESERDRPQFDAIQEALCVISEQIEVLTDRIIRLETAKKAQPKLFE